MPEDFEKGEEKSNLDKEAVPGRNLLRCRRGASEQEGRKGREYNIRRA
ncbi:MAG: hypothetical protein ACR2PI_01415 [Hyphomicrobiaceae bacterium]